MRLVPNSESLREANSCHHPAGSSKGGQFCSKDEIAAGRPWNATEDEFVAYHRTGHIPSDAYEDAENGKFDYIHRERFQTLLATRTINGEKVEIRVEAEEARYPKRVPEQQDREKLWDAFNAEARKLGTDVMSAGIDLGRDSPEYAHLQRFEKAWLDAGERWERDANGELMYHTPEEIHSKGLPPFIYTVAAFVGDKAVGYAGDEFGATGVYVSKAFQRHGLGKTLLRAYLEKSGRLARGAKLGQMTDAGVALTRALHRQLRSERPTVEALRRYTTRVRKGRASK